jgi:exopolyphosphatase/guanosine-5'-triphosphate,3'-diphosphate pyrophosphatase
METSNNNNLNYDHVFAAVDLGSNSFHMVMSVYEKGQFTVVERQKKTVRLAAGLDENGLLMPEAWERAIQCLQEFAQLLGPLPEGNVRVVGTNALRRMKNKRAFLDQAEQALDRTIEIVAGREEARLIYLGVSKWSDLGEDKRLIIDIGGGSTEIIVGDGEKPLSRESTEVGCVVLNELFFSDGILSLERFNAAKLAAELAIQPVVEQFKHIGWDSVLGCSGTMRSVSTILTNLQWSREGISSDSLQKLLKYVVDAGSVDKLDLPGLSDDRRQVFAGGLSVLLALFELFSIDELEVSDIALREGVLYDLVGRSSSEDVRDGTVQAMLQRWAIDPDHASAVSDTALSLYDQVAVFWGINTPVYRSMLGWAAHLHELGLLISHDGYHYHGAYVIERADMAGFARRDQLLLSALVQGHRRKFPLNLFEELPASLVTPAKRLAVLLRLAVMFHRGRGSNVPNAIDIDVKGREVTLCFEQGWLKDHPLTEADLQQEKVWLKTIGVKLAFS